MAVVIHKADKAGRPAMIADRDFYLDASRKKVIVVDAGQDPPAEAAFVLAMKGSWVPKEYEELVKGLIEPKVDEVKAEAKAESEVQVVPEPVAEPVVEHPQPVPQPEPAKEKKQK